MGGMKAVCYKALFPFYMSTLLLWGTVLSTLLVTAKLVLVPLVSRVLYMHVCGALSKGITAMMLWYFQTAGNVRVHVYTEVPLEELVRPHTTLTLWNHVTDLDWVVMPWFMHRIGKLGELRTLVKDSLKYVPVFGWMWKLADFIFLKRSMEKDQKALDYGMSKITRCREGDSFGVIHYWASLFPEGTRYTPAKLAASQEWQKSQGMVPMKNVQFPRTKGVSSLWKGMGHQIDSVYTVCLGYVGNKAPGYGQLLNNDRFDIAMYIRKVDKAVMPSPDAADVDEKVKAVVVDHWRAFDKDLDQFHATHSFPAPLLPAVSAPVGNVDWYFPPLLVAFQTLMAVGIAKASASWWPLQMWFGAHFALSALSVCFIGRKPFDGKPSKAKAA